MHNFKELNIWTDSLNLVSKIYDITNEFPESERYGLTSQIRRSSVSIPSNIAEGSGRKSPDFSRFLGIALSSAFELETQLIISNKLGLMNDKDLTILLDELGVIQKMIYRFKEKICLEIK